MMVGRKLDSASAFMQCSRFSTLLVMEAMSGDYSYGSMVALSDFSQANDGRHCSLNGEDASLYSSENRHGVIGATLHMF